ncbi:MAG: NUDIX domain-containing protein [Victivallales bacterium]|nr:NUDIX domain-containing protein [Victivallales bacterium]
MIEDATNGRVLVQHRLPKPTNPWCGLTFPGGHVEAGESITASTIREIHEETGLTVSKLHLCGVIEWETIGERTDGSPAEVTANSKYIVFLFRTSSFTGELKSSAEGRMEWMTLDDMRRGGLAPNMEEYIRVLLEDDAPQAYGISGSNQLTTLDGNGKPLPEYDKYSPEWFFQKIGIDVQSFQSKLTTEQNKLMKWFWNQPQSIQYSLLQCFSSRQDFVWNLPNCPPAYRESLPFLKNAGIIEEYFTIDEISLQKYRSLFKEFKPNILDHNGMTFIKNAVSGGIFCELATQWKAERAIERFKIDHPTIDCRVWHNIILLKKNGSPLTDCDVLVRVGIHFYYIEVKACSAVAESFSNGRQSTKIKLLLEKDKNCKHIYCIGFDDFERPFSQDYLELSTFDKDFYNIISNDFKNLSSRTI